ncbi:hypothetical protein GMMP15_650010 [Candidatus Magnetomoraceae bacterium gMMP-15]
MNTPKLLYCLWILALGAVVVMSSNGNHESTDFQGIADTREIVVNSENAVEIKRIRVIPGQVIKSGDLLVELDQPELIMKINEISHELEEFKNRKYLNTEDIKSRIRQLKAKKASVTSEIDYKIKQLMSRHNFNKNLTSRLKSLQQIDKNEKKMSISSPIALEIESLREERKLALNQIKIEMEGLHTEQNSPEMTIRIQSLEKELKMLELEKEHLLIYSQINGVIGSVHFKPGEKASPFAPILTLYTKAPSYIKGYIHEKLYNRILVGEKVAVLSTAGNNCCTSGIVVGVGSRIVEYPARLRKRPEIQMWGREVQIRISEDNSFLLGERVMILPVENRAPSYWARLTDLWDSGLAYAELLKNSDMDQSLL